MKNETQLIVSEADKALSWRELDDATLGKFARYFIITANRTEQERADRDEWPMMALQAMHGGIALCRMAQEANADRATWEMDGIHDANGNLGDWKITAKRIRAPRDRDRYPEGDETRSGSVERSEIEPGPSGIAQNGSG